LTVVLVIHRESDLQKFYDDPFVDPPESEINGLDNHLVQSQPLRSRDNLYEYKDSPGKFKKSQSDLNSMRSPSSLGTTQMTKVSGSQSSLKSAISMKESPSFPNSKEIPYKKEKFSEREIDVKSDRSELTEKGSIVSSTTTNTSSKRDFLTSSPVARPRTPRSTKSSRTVLDAGGIPQTEV
jgi:hypothetical protein